MNNNLREEMEEKVRVAMEDAFNLGVAYANNKIDIAHLEVRWHATKIASLLYSHLIKKLPKEKDEEGIFSPRWTQILGFNQAISEIKQILGRELKGK